MPADPTGSRTARIRPGTTAPDQCAPSFKCVVASRVRGRTLEPDPVNAGMRRRQGVHFCGKRLNAFVVKNCCQLKPFRPTTLPTSRISSNFHSSYKGMTQSPIPHSLLPQAAARWPHSKPQFPMICHGRCTQLRVHAASLFIAWWKRRFAASFHPNPSRTRPKHSRPGVCSDVLLLGQPVEREESQDRREVGRRHAMDDRD